jgi:PAS domain S-box-containing protein
MISVLYVDDEETLLDIGKLFLERSGEIYVEVNTSAKDALALIEKTRFDAVVADYQMPEMDGIALLKEVRSRHPELPFILFTGKGREEVVIEAINNGADFYLQKGGDPKSQFVELEHKIRQAVQRRNVNVALKESETRYRTVFESTGTAMVIIEEDNTISLVNNEFLRLSGYSQDDIDSRKSWTEFVYKEDLEKMITQHRIRRERREDALRQYEFRLLTKSGKIRDILLTVDMFPGTKKSIASLIDITDRSHAEMELLKKNEEIQAAYNKLTTIEETLRHNFEELTKSQQALAESRQMLQSVLDTIQVRVFWKDTDLKYLGCNRPFAHDSGFAFPHDLVGKSDYEMGWADQADLYRADDRAVIDTGIPKLNYEEQLTMSDGGRMWLRTSKIPLKDTQGTTRGVLGTCEDITAWKEAQIRITNLAQFPAQNPNPIMRADADGVLCYANPASDRVLTALGMSVGGPLSPEWQQWVMDAIASGTPVAFEQTAGGSTYSITLVPFADEKFANLYFLDITPEKEAERVLKQRAERSIQYQKALVSLATTDAPTLRDAMNRITETGATILGVERVGIWFFSADSATLFCSDLYTRTRSLHESGHTITGADYPRYFAALQDNRTIVAADARAHEHTSEFASGYLEPQNISSMLHVPVRSGRTVVGVLCFDHTGPARSWDAGDQDFAASVADFAAIVLEKARRRLAEKDLQKSEERARVTQFAVEHAAEGILWLNTAGNVVYANPAYCRMLGYTSDELLKLTIFDIEPTMPREGWSDRKGRKDERGSFTFETHHAKKGGERFPVDVTSDYFTYAGETYICSYVRDISERTREQKALRLANQKLNLLSSVTRHDILNKLTIVLGYLGLSKVAHDQEKLEDFIKKIDETIAVIQDQIQFTRDYQDMGVKAPEWQDAAAVFAKVLSQLDLGTVRVHNDFSGLSLYADPLLERAMYNIVDNAMRYGEKVATIRARYLVKDDEGLIWIIEDDGVGISAKDKSLIFNKGFGHHTGLGLFLTREILSITGMMIMETGFPGTGARFEIHVPPGGYRLA